jgi:hypothetical protein
MPFRRPAVLERRHQRKPAVIGQDQLGVQVTALLPRPDLELPARDLAVVPLEGETWELLITPSPPLHQVSHTARAMSHCRQIKEYLCNSVRRPAIISVAIHTDVVSSARARHRC